MLLVEKNTVSIADIYNTVPNYLAELTLIAIIVGIIIGLYKTIKTKDIEKKANYIMASFRWSLGVIVIRYGVGFATLSYKYNIIQLNFSSYMNFIKMILALFLLVVVFCNGIFLIISSAKVIFSKNQSDAVQKKQ